MNTPYHRLGDYIHEVNIRNRDLKVTKPMGINIDKHFMPSVANVIGTDLSNYKMVHKKQFACNLMHVGRDEKIPMAMQTEDKPIIVSPAYFVFEIIKTDMLLPEYLIMWFSRPKFDRNAWFYTDADVRGGMDKKAFMDMRLPVPALARQREIVAEYETLTHRIRLNEQMIAKLEETAQALYRKMFVEGVDKENLIPLSDICDFQEGYVNPAQEYPEFFNGEIKWLRAIDVTGGYIFNTTRTLTKLGFESAGKSAQLFPPNSIVITKSGTIGRLGILADYMCGNRAVINIRTKKKEWLPLVFLFLLSKQNEFENMAVGSAQKNLYVPVLAQMGIFIPPQYNYNEFNTIFNSIYHYQRENEKLTELQSLLLAKMGNM